MLKSGFCVAFLVFALAIPCAAQDTVVYSDDFEEPDAGAWDLERGWSLEEDRGNGVLHGTGHAWARLRNREALTDYILRSRVTLQSGGVHVVFRASDEGRYFVGLRPGFVYLNKEAPWGEFVELGQAEAPVEPGAWHDLEIQARGNDISVRLDDTPVLEVSDRSPLTSGGVAYETLDESIADIDDLAILVFDSGTETISSPLKTVPVVKVKKSMDALGPDKKGIDMLESATITIKVDGDSVKNPKGLSVVLILDESGSMDGLEGHSRGGAKAVVSLLDPSDKVALITFGTSATLVSGLTTDHKKVLQAIDKLSDPDGKTNVKQAFDLANTTLKGDKTAVKLAAFLFTDGMPTPQTQTDELIKAVPSLNAANINYFTAGYGSFSKAWLISLAKDTGGTFCDPKTPAEITTCFKSAWTELSKFAHAQQVTIHEKLSANFSVVPGSLMHATSFVSLPKYLKDKLDQAETAFYATGELNTPPIYELPQGEFFSVSFDVTPKTCKPVLTELPVNDITKTYLQYKYKGKAITVGHPEFNQVKVPVNPCGVYVDKKFETANRVVRITIRNTFQDRDVCDIHVREILGDHVTPIAATATPFNYVGLGQVVWPHYPESSAWTPDGVEWRFFNGVPATGGQYTPYGWKVVGPPGVSGHFCIKANKKLELALPINSKASAKGLSPVVINKETQNFPDKKSIQGGRITFWYNYELFGDTKIKSAQKGGYTYKYYYESLPTTSATQKWGYKRHVVIDLPKLEVMKLPPEWPIYK